MFPRQIVVDQECCKNDLQPPDGQEASRADMIPVAESVPFMSAACLNSCCRDCLLTSCWWLQLGMPPTDCQTHALHLAWPT